MEDGEGIPVDELEAKVNPNLSCRVVDCGEITTRPSGYCKRHEEEMAYMLQDPVMSCPNCPLGDNCPMFDTSRKWCYYEIDLVADDFNNRASVEDEFRDMLHDIRKTAKRLRREAHAVILNKDDPFGDIEYDPEDTEMAKLKVALELKRAEDMKLHLSILAEARRQEELLGKHLIAYVKFMGWAEQKLTKDEKMARVKAAMEAIGSKEFKVATIKARRSASDKSEYSNETPPILVDGTDFDMMPPGIEYDDSADISKAKDELVANPNKDDIDYGIDFKDPQADIDTTVDDDVQTLEEIMSENDVNDPEFLGAKTESGDDPDTESDGKSIRNSPRQISRKRGVSSR